MPSQHGEGTVLRLLPSHNGLLDLDRLGMPARILARVRAFAEEPHGMALVTGPTGSGKTTTLYGLLASLNTPDNKIITVEDPVEYRLPGAIQVQVNDRINLTFGTVLRSTLRQDPDVVLVGEMRDQDTVETGLRAAMTGHMVLSTLHTNDSASAPLRLLDMNAPLFLVASSLRLVLAQRLVRTVCTHCAEPHRATPREHAFLHMHLHATSDAAVGADSPLRTGRGCSHCHGTGFVGRHGVYELLEMTPEVVRPLAAGDTTQYLTLARRAVGINALAHHACELALAGVTTVREAIRTVGRGYDAV
jgi:MSHA biogenesis protein MshE